MKKKTTRRQVLLSFLGTTDPIRGECDGAMLHILRHYRPEVVCLLFTPEVRKLAEADERYEKVFFHLKSHWDGYAPVVLEQDFSVSDVSDMDELDQPLHDVMNRLSREYADAEILVNITSGTPQMQMLLSQMVLELRYHARGIQVKTPEKKAGTTVRTNDSENYDIDLEIECNEDEQEGAPNRCVEPEMFSVRRKNQWQQVEALLNQRCFRGFAEMRPAPLSEELMALVKHMAYRNDLLPEEARKAVRGYGLSLKLYLPEAAPAHQDICEYALLMKNLLCSHSYTEFVLHMEPLTLRLQETLLNQLLPRRYGYDLTHVQSKYGGRMKIEPGLMQEKMPELYDRLYVTGTWECRASDLSTPFCDDILDILSTQPEETKTYFRCYADLKEVRNGLAHRLCAVTADEIRAACGKTPEQIISLIERCILLLFPACDPEVFHIYERIIRYIQKQY